MNLFLNLQDVLENTEDCRTSPLYGLTSLVPQDVLPSPVESTHVEEMVQDAVVHTSLFLLDGTSNSNVVPPQSVVVVTIRQGVSMPTTSGHVVIGQLHTTQDRTINNL